jgi:hypothetical protein
MKRADLEHILRACKAITRESEFIIIGSQSILGAFPDAPRELRKSMEVDLYPRKRPELAGLIEGSLGELSTFEATFGYRADGVAPETAVLPANWTDRLVSVQTDMTEGAIGWCLEPHDLAFSKLAARRTKDLDFVAGLLRFRMISRAKLERLISAESEPLKSRLTEALQIALARNRT